MKVTDVALIHALCCFVKLTKTNHCISHLHLNVLCEECWWWESSGLGRDSWQHPLLIQDRRTMDTFKSSKHQKSLKKTRQIFNNPRKISKFVKCHQSFRSASTSSHTITVFLIISSTIASLSAFSLSHSFFRLSSVPLSYIHSLSQNKKCFSKRLM